MSAVFTYSQVHHEFFQQHGKQVVYKKGQHLVRDDDPSPWVFFMVEGAVKISFYAADASERIVGFFIPGMTFAQSGSFTGRNPESLLYEAHTNCTLYRLPRDVFMQELTHNIPFITDYTNRILQNQRFLIERIVYQGEKSLDQRFLGWLLCMAKFYGTPNGTACRIDIPLTQDVIANLVHTTRESVSKQLTRLKHQRLLTTDDKFITIPDVSKIESLLQEV